MKGYTVKSSFSIKGNGIHTNDISVITFYPHYDGIAFRVKDVIIPANIDFVFSTKYELSLCFGDYTVRSVEHILSALYGVGITSCVIELDGLELPILDGSSDIITKAIISSGFIELDKDINYRSISYPFGIMDDFRYIYAKPCDGLIINYIISYSHPMLERQYYRFRYSRDNYINELSMARTFGFINHWDSLKEQGLALGASRDNVIIFTEDGILNPPLRYLDECVRHKVLDFISALSLLSYRINGEFYIYRSGHTMDIRFMRLLSSILDNGLSRAGIDSVKERSRVISEFVSKDFDIC